MSWMAAIEWQTRVGICGFGVKIGDDGVVGDAEVHVQVWDVACTVVGCELYGWVQRVNPLQKQVQLFFSVKPHHQ